MSITLVCPACGTAGLVDSPDGKLRRCGCGAIIRPQFAPLDRTRKSIAVVCPECSRGYEVPASAQETWLRCLCGTSFPAHPAECLQAAMSAPEDAGAFQINTDISPVAPAAVAESTWSSLALESVDGDSVLPFSIVTEPSPELAVATPRESAKTSSPNRTSSTSKTRGRKSSGLPWAWIVAGVSIVAIVVVVAIMMNAGDNGDDEVASSGSPKEQSSAGRDSVIEEAADESSVSAQTTDSSAVPASPGVPSDVAPTIGIGDVAPVESDTVMIEEEQPLEDEVQPPTPLRHMIAPDEPPRNFNDVVFQAIDSLELSKEILLRIEQDPSEENRADYINAIARTGGWLEAAIPLAPSGDPSVWELLYLLAYCHSQLDRHYEAAVLGEYVATQAPSETTVAGESALISFAAYLKAFQASPSDARHAEADGVVRMGQWIETHAPTSPQILQVQYTVAQVLQSVDRIVEAREWYIRLPQGTPEYAKGIAVVGQLEWNLAKRITDAESAGIDPAAARPMPTLPGDLPDHPALVQAAEAHLREGITLLAADPMPGDSLVISKAYLAELLVLNGNGTEALQWLSAEPRPVLAEVDPPEGQRRPARGIASREFAAGAAQTQLLAYSLAGNLTEARVAVNRLRQLATPEVFRSLVLRVSRQLVDAAASQPIETREAALTQNLELVQSVALVAGAEAELLQWAVVVGQEIAELASSDETKGTAYQISASAAQRWLESAATNEATPEELLSMRVIQAKMLSGSGAYAEAHARFEELLAAQPTLWELQMVAALNLERWAAAEQSYSRYLQALSGTAPGEASGIWGWGRLSSAVSASAGEITPPEQIATRFEVAAHIAECRLGLAATAADEETRKTTLGTGAFELTAFAEQVAHLEGDWDRLQEVYDRLLAELGEPSRPLRMEADGT